MAASAVPAVGPGVQLFGQEISMAAPVLSGGRGPLFL